MVKPILQNPWTVRLLTALVWGLLLGSVVYWGLALGGRHAVGTVQVASARALTLNEQGLPYLLGQRQVPVVKVENQPTRDEYQLVGVLAGTQSQQGAALISVNGQPARAYRVGSTVEGRDGFVLQSLKGRIANLAASVESTSVNVLEMPEFNPAQATPSGGKPPVLTPNPSANAAKTTNTGAARPAPATAGLKKYERGADL